MEQHFVLVLDDTGFNAFEKKSNILQSEKATFCCVIVPTCQISGINNLFYDPNLGLGTLLKQKFGSDEFHFCEIYNHKNKFKDIDYQEMLDIVETFATLVADLDLDVLTATQNAHTFDNLPKFEEQFKRLAAHVRLPTDKSHADKSIALLRAILLAKAQLEQNYDNPIVDKIICDQGLLEEGKTLSIPLFDAKTTPINFENSAKNPLLQIADFCAWAVTRMKNSYDGKNKLSESHVEILSRLSICADNFVNLAQVAIDPNNLDDYDTVIENNKK